MATKIKFEHPLERIIQVPKTDRFDSLNCYVRVDLNLDKNNEYAVSANVTSRRYVLGFEKDIYSHLSELFYDSPSKVNAKLRTRGVDVDVKDVEKSFCEEAVKRYNYGVDADKYESSKKDFENRAENFLRELKELEAKYKVKPSIDISYEDEYTPCIDVDIMDFDRREFYRTIKDDKEMCEYFM